jgi:hypothetical protein
MKCCVVIFAGILCAQSVTFPGPGSPSGAPPIALVSQTCNGLGANGGTTSAINTTGANFIAISVAFNYNVIPIGSDISDSKGNSYTALTTHQENTGSANRLFYVAAPTVGASHTFTVTKTGAFVAVCVAAFSAVATSSPFDVENGATVGSGTTLATGSVTPSLNNEVVIAGICTGGAATSSIDSGFTLVGTVAGDNATYYGVGMGYLVQTTAGAINPTWTRSNSGKMSASIASFQAQ